MIILSTFANYIFFCNFCNFSPIKIEKKKFDFFLKQLGDSPKKKRNISANGRRLLCKKAGPILHIVLLADVNYFHFLFFSSINHRGGANSIVSQPYSILSPWFFIPPPQNLSETPFLPRSANTPADFSQHECLQSSYLRIHANGRKPIAQYSDATR